MYVAYLQLVCYISLLVEWVWLAGCGIQLSTVTNVLLIGKSHLSILSNARLVYRRWALCCIRCYLKRFYEWLASRLIKCMFTCSLLKNVVVIVIVCLFFFGKNVRLLFVPSFWVTPCWLLVSYVLPTLMFLISCVIRRFVAAKCPYCWRLFKTFICCWRNIIKRSIVWCAVKWM